VCYRLFPEVPYYQSTISVAALRDVAITAKATAAFSIHNNGDDDWDLAPLGPMTLGNADVTADNGKDGHHVDQCGLQVFDVLSSSSILQSLMIVMGVEEL
jgi:hypothetical protein